MLSEGQIIKEVYEIREPIGEGGAGQVFLAWHRNLQIPVVVKRIKDHYVGKINERNEVDILKNLKHQYLPIVYDYVQMEDEVFTVIDYVDGNTLQDYIDAGVRFTEAQIIRWLTQLCEALKYLHGQKPAIIHSDIKPSNIMITKGGDICLIDFNISFDENDPDRITGISRNYASPEQISRAELFSSGRNYMDITLDARSDIFSLGASMFHLMAKRNAISQLNAKGNLWQAGIPIPYSKTLRDIIEKSLQPNPKNRYQTAEAMLKDILSMKKRDARYSALKKQQLAFTAVFGAMVVAGAFLISRGAVLRNEEDFYSAYETVVENPDAEAALALLNDRKYAGILTDDSTERANLLYLIGNTYFEEEDYENAVRFYEMTVKCSKENPDYYRDYAIATARLGDTAKAKDILAEGEKNGLTNADLMLVQGEIYVQEGAWEDAIYAFRAVIAAPESEDRLGRAYYLCAEAYCSMGAPDLASQLLDEAYPLVNEVWKNRILREQGNACIALIEKEGYENAGAWVQRARASFEELIQSPTASFSDYLNYEVLLEMQGDLTGAEAMLTKMAELYPDEYKVPMRSAYLELTKQAALPESGRNYHATEAYYNTATELYEKYKNAGRTDDEMQRLDGLMQDLRSFGWL